MFLVDLWWRKSFEEYTARDRMRPPPPHGHHANAISTVEINASFKQNASRTLDATVPTGVRRKSKHPGNHRGKLLYRCGVVIHHGCA